MPAPNAAYDHLRRHAKETALLRAIDGLLSWDQQTYMPAGASDYRVEQMSYLAGMVHARQTDPRVGEWLAELAGSELAGDTQSDSGATIRELSRAFEKKKKLPQTLVEELARATAQGQMIWIEARKNDDFSHFEPVLTKIYELKRQEAAAIGFDDSPYDPLLDDYEPHQKTADLRGVLAGLRDALVPLVGAIAESGKVAPLEIVQRNFPVAAQEAFGREAATAIGFDFERGRLDVTHHPFCGGAGPDDVRITTRYLEHHFNSAFFGILHEVGHGLYEQGLPSEEFGLPLGEAISLGIHESQSRMWENMVGRSLGFWQHWYAKAKSHFPATLGDTSLEDFHFAVNDVRPSLIRVEADEATYNLHILIRFELEQALLTGDLPVADLPAAWNSKYTEYLGITPASDADGVLQDIHWSAGLIGYFPTYSLGNLYAAQFFEAAAQELGDLPTMFSQGEYQPLLDWLRKNIHVHGQRHPATELIERVSGRPLSHEPLIRYLTDKLGGLYGVK